MGNCLGKSKALSLFLVILFLFSSNIEAATICIALSGGLRIKKEVKDLQEIKSQNVIKQSLDYSCGPASIATLLTYYFSEEITEKEIIEFLLKTVDLEKVKKRGGFSLLNLKRFAQSKGYQVVGYKMDLEYLVELNKPVLIPVELKDYEHFVIFRGVRGDRVYLADSSLGNMTMKAERFLRMWKGGIGLVLTRDGQEIDSYPLQVGSDEAIIPDGQSLHRLLEGHGLSSVYYPGEF